MSTNAFTAVGTPLTSASASTLSPPLPVQTGQILTAVVTIASNATITTATLGWTKLTQVNGTTGLTTAVFWALAGSAAPTFSWSGAVSCLSAITSWSHPVGVFTSVAVLNSFVNTTPTFTVGQTASVRSPGYVALYLSGTANSFFTNVQPNIWNANQAGNATQGNLHNSVRWPLRPANTFPASDFNRANNSNVSIVIELLASEAAANENETSELELVPQLGRQGVEAKEIELALLRGGVEATTIEIVPLPGGIQSTEIELVPLFSANKIDVPELELAIQYGGLPILEVEVVPLLKPEPINAVRGKFIWIG